MRDEKYRKTDSREEKRAGKRDDERRKQGELSGRTEED